MVGIVGEDEYSVGLCEIFDIKYGGIEKYGVKYCYFGILVLVEKMVDVVIESGVDVIFIFMIISYNDIYCIMMWKLVDLVIEKGICDKVVFVVGGI